MTLDDQPERSPLQRPIIVICPLDHSVSRGGQAQTRRCRNAQGRAQTKSVQSLSDWIVFDQQLQCLTGSMDEILHLEHKYNPSLRFGATET